MTYSVQCECGKIHPVSTGDAGSSLTCTCGRIVSIPSLGILRQLSGELGGSPEMILDSMLQNGELPENSSCVVCGVDTDHARHFEVVCEEVQSATGGSGLFAFFTAVTSWIWAPLFYMSMLKREAQEPHGRNVHYRLPLRICPGCDTTRHATEIQELFCRVPVYHHLLNKYPHAQISAV